MIAPHFLGAQRKEMNMFEGNAQKARMVEAAQACGSTSQMHNQGLSATAIPKDNSPVEVQLNQQSILLSDLRDAISEVINAIKPIMGHDPREQPGCEVAKPGSPVRCQLEAELSNRNSTLCDQIQLLRQVRETICL